MNDLLFILNIVHRFVTYLNRLNIRGVILIIIVFLTIEFPHYQN